MARAAALFREERPEVELLLLGHHGAPSGGADFIPVGRWEGRNQQGAGAVSGAALERATAMALSGEVAGVVTGPVHKPALHDAGYPFPGQTEMFREWAGAPVVGMLMASERTLTGGALRVLLATTHIPLRDVPRSVTTRLLVEQTGLLVRSLREGWGIPAPRVALCALNPHASDGGLFGDEEERVFRPALLSLQDEGLDVEGPFPADTVFRRALEGALDAVVAPYHDVGMAAFKTVAFGGGVNVTLGLPFVRTSPDHGTAFDLAGRGTADPSSALEAIRLAARIAARRFDTAPRVEVVSSHPQGPAQTGTAT